MPVLDSGGMVKDYDLHKVGVLSTRIEDMELLAEQICHGSSVEKDSTKVRDCRKEPCISFAPH